MTHQQKCYLIGLLASDSFTVEYFRAELERLLSSEKGMPPPTGAMWCLWNGSHKVDAIKMYRTAYPFGLKEIKELFEAGQK